MKKRFSPFVYSCLFTVTSILSFPKITLAQLRLGTGVQPGLEGYFLEYQQRGLPLQEIRGASGCSVGFGASCNKTGALLQKIVKEHSGLGYQELLIKAAGGANNYQKFIQLYSNPSVVSLMPYSSFWRNGNEYIIDSYENSGVGALNGGDSSSLQEIASNFKYAPITWGNDNMTLRRGIVGLKTSYGLTLVEEALKVPNINQKIAEVSLNETEASFHQQQFQRAVSALNSNSPEQLTNALFYVLSNPYTEVPAPLNRPKLNIAEDITRVEGIALEGDVDSRVAMVGEGESVLLPTLDEVMESAAVSGYALAGVGGIALLVFLLGDGGGSNGDTSLLPISTDNVLVPSELLPEDNVIPAENPSPPVIKVENQVNNNTGGGNALEIPEPSGLKTFFFLSCLFFLFKGKKAII